MLDTLPVEIIQRIASFGSCESNLALLKVNRTISRACNDRIVFKGIIENGNGSSADIPIWRCVPLSIQAPITSWAKYALADSKATRLSCRYAIADDIAIHHDIHDLAVSLPQLIASHHPVFDYVSAEYLFDRLHRGLHLISQYSEAGEELLRNRQTHQDTEVTRAEMNAVKESYCDPETEAYALSFCFAARLISLCALGDTGSLVSTSGSTEATLETKKEARGWITKRRQLLNGLKEPLFDHGATQTVHIRHRTTANRSLAIFAFELRSAIASGRFRRISGYYSSNTSTATDIQASSLPSARSIPFLSLIHPLPLPFTTKSGGTLPESHSHLPAMTSPEFLCSGSWTGYYSYPHRDGDHLPFDPPMCGITFAAATTPRSVNMGSKQLKLSGDGFDAIGKFTLNGAIEPADGSLIMMKKYTEGGMHSWRWDALMTPFGIYGNWGSSHFLSSFWLWKTDWATGGEAGEFTQSAS